MASRFAFVTFGDQETLHLQAWYAMLSILAFAPPRTELVMVTDAPERYRWFGDRVRLLPVERAQFGRWRGPHDYLWRVKLEAVRLVASLGPEPLVYCDCDVVARADLQSMLALLEAGTVFMHHKEEALGRMKRPTLRRLRDHVAGRTWAGIPVTDADAMWNAGVVAVRDHALIDRALVLNDELMDSGFRYEFYEQLAFSLCLNATGRLQAAERWMVHYWDNKKGWLISIAEIISGIPMLGLDIDGAIAHVRANPITRPIQIRKRWWNRYFVGLAGADY